LWQITSYPRALTAEQRRRRALALLTEHYGRKWKSKAPADVVWMLSDGVMLDEALARVTEITAPKQDPPEQAPEPAPPRRGAPRRARRPRAASPPTTRPGPSPSSMPNPASPAPSWGAASASAPARASAS